MRGTGPQMSVEMCYTSLCADMGALKGHPSSDSSPWTSIFLCRSISTATSDVAPDSALVGVHSHCHTVIHRTIFLKRTN